MKEFKPIVEEVKLGPVGMRRRPPIRGGLATVLEGREGYKTFEPHDPPTMADMIAGNHRRLYRVDLSPYSVALRFDVPCRGDAWHFHANAMLTVSVSDPAAVVRLRMVDASVVESLIMRRLRQLSRGFNVAEVEQAEEALNDYLQNQDFPEVGFRIKYGWVTLAVDESEVQYRRHDVLLRRDMERAAGQDELQRQQAEFAAARNRAEANHRRELEALQAHHEAELQRTRTESELKLQTEREAHRRQLENERIAIYRQAIQMDVPDLLLLRLATHPEDADTVVNILANQERAKLNIHLQFFESILNKEDVVHAWQLEEPVLKMLQRFVEVFTPLGRGQDTAIPVDARVMETADGNNQQERHQTTGLDS
jgi:hypothetical protein